MNFCVDIQHNKQPVMTSINTHVPDMLVENNVLAIGFPSVIYPSETPYQVHIASNSVSTNIIMQIILFVKVAN